MLLMHLLKVGPAGRRVSALVASLCLVCLWSWPVAGDGPPEQAAVRPAQPIETYIQIGAAGSPQISADGASVLFVSAMSGVDQVYQILRSGWPYQLTAFVDGIDFYATSYTGRRVVVGASEGGSEQSNLYLVDTDTYLVTPLKQAAGVQHGSPVVESGRALCVLPEQRGNRKGLLHLPDRGHLRGRGYSVEAHRLERACGCVGRRHLAAGVSLGVQRRQRPLPGRCRSWVATYMLTAHTGDCIFEDGQVTPDLKYVYFVTNMNDEGIARVARRQVPGGKIEFINPDSPWETEEMDLSDDGETLAWIENVEGYGVVRILDLAGGDITDISEMKGVASGLSVSNAERLVFSFQSASAPADVWDYDLDEQDLDRLTRSDARGRRCRRSSSSPSWCTTRASTGWGSRRFCICPGIGTGARYPSSSTSTGGPRASSGRTFNRHFQYLVASGYGDFRAQRAGQFGLRPGRTCKLDDYKNRKNAIRDIYEGAQVAGGPRLRRLRQDRHQGRAPTAATPRWRRWWSTRRSSGPGWTTSASPTSSPSSPTPRPTAGRCGKRSTGR